MNNQIISDKHKRLIRIAVQNEISSNKHGGLCDIMRDIQTRTTKGEISDKEKRHYTLEVFRLYTTVKRINQSIQKHGFCMIYKDKKQILNKYLFSVRK